MFNCNICLLSFSSLSIIINDLQNPFQAFFWITFKKYLMFSLSKLKCTTSENGSYYLLLLHSCFVFCVAFLYPYKKKLCGQIVIIIYIYVLIDIYTICINHDVLPWFCNKLLIGKLIGLCLKFYFKCSRFVSVCVLEVK